MTAPSGSVGLPIFVGECNPYGEDPRYALYDEPTNASGARLRRILGLERRNYFACGRVNLCTGAWSLKDARARAVELLAAFPGCRFVLLGRKVAAGFRQKGDAFTTSERFVLLPHPSGLCRVWDEPGTVELAREMLSCEFPGYDGKAPERDPEAVAMHALNRPQAEFIWASPACGVPVRGILPTRDGIAGKRFS